MMRWCMPRRDKPSMADVVSRPVSTRKRSRFEYTPYKESVRLSARKATVREKQGGGADERYLPGSVHMLDSSELDASLDTSVDRNYIEIIAVASPGSAAEAFAKFESETKGVVSPHQHYRLPSVVKKNPLFESADGDEGAMEHASRSNPQFDAATLAAVFSVGQPDGELDSVPGSDHESEGADGGYGFDVEDIVAGRAEADTQGWGFGDVWDEPAQADGGGSDDSGLAQQRRAPDAATLERLQKEMDAALEVLNTPTELHERVDALKRVKELLGEDPACVQECVDMNGVLSIVSAIKEDVDEELQTLGLQALTTLAGSNEALREILQAHAMNFWAHSLDVEPLWQEALAGLAKAARSEQALHLMISEGVPRRLSDRLPFASPDGDLSLAMRVLVAVCGTAERLAKLDGVFEAMAMTMADPACRKVMTDDAVVAVDSAVQSFGADAAGLVRSSGLADALSALPSSVQASNPALRRVLETLDAPDV